jgi:hypothetical protein
LLADAAYDSEANHVLCREVLGIESIIPPRMGRKPRKPSRSPSTPHRKRMKQHFPAKRYGQRWQIESAISQDKRRFGSAIEGRSWQTILQAVLMRVLVHNIALLLLSLRRQPHFSTEQVRPYYFTIFSSKGGDAPSSA